MRFRRARKLSLFTLAILAVALGTAIYLPLGMYWDIRDRMSENLLRREARLSEYLDIVQTLYRSGADGEINELLKKMVARYDVSYYVIYKDKQLVFAYPEVHPLAVGHTFEQRAPLAGKDLIDSVRSERSEFVSDDILLTIGIDKRSNTYVWEAFFGKSQAWKVVVQDIVMIILLAAVAIWLHTRDLVRLRKEIARFGRVPKTENAAKALSAESEAIIAGLSGYAKSEQKQKEKAEKLSGQVLPALKREIFSGQEPPYTFDCTLVRTDINGFSQIFNSPYRDRFTRHIHDFFLGLTEIVSRYDGLIYEFVGDEAIFYFKDSTSESHSSHDGDHEVGPSTSLNRAIDAIRDIHFLARDINSRTQLEGHRFTVKSALAHGTLLFGPLVDGHSLSGGVLIETVRILSTVTDKEENHLYFASRHTPYLRDDMHAERVGVFSLKGYSDDVTLVRWTSTTELSAHLADVGKAPLLYIQSQGPFDFVSRHRSDFSLETLITSAASARDSWKIETHLQLATALRPIKIYRPHHPLGPALSDWLSNTRDLAHDDREWHHVSSAILMLFPILVPKNSIGAKDIEHIESHLDSEDTRTIANAIAVLTCYEAKPTIRPLKALFGSENNRIAANALIHEGTQDLSKDVLQKLEQMIFGRSTEDARRASGLYALGEIARILRAKDGVYYSTRVDLHRLIGRAETLVSHRNESVALQATRAVAKATNDSDDGFSAAA